MNLCRETGKIVGVILCKETDGGWGVIGCSRSSQRLTIMYVLVMSKRLLSGKEKKVM